MENYSTMNWENFMSYLENFDDILPYAYETGYPDRYLFNNENYALEPSYFTHRAWIYWTYMAKKYGECLLENTDEIPASVKDKEIFEIIKTHGEIIDFADAYRRLPEDHE